MTVPSYRKRLDGRRIEESESDVVPVPRAAGADVGLLAGHDGGVAESLLPTVDLNGSAAETGVTWPALRRWSQVPFSSESRSYRSSPGIRRLYDPIVTPLNVNGAVQYVQQNGAALLTALFNAM